MRKTEKEAGVSEEVRMWEIRVKWMCRIRVSDPKNLGEKSKETLLLLYYISYPMNL